MLFSEFKERTDFFEIKIAKGLRNYINRRSEGKSQTHYSKNGDKKLEILEEKDLRGPFSFLFPERDKIEAFLKRWPDSTAVFRIISSEKEILSPSGERVEKSEYLETFKVSVKKGNNIFEDSDFSFEKGGIDFSKVEKNFSLYLEKSKNSLKVKNRKYPVLFRGQAAGLIIHEFFGHLLEADLSEKSKTPFKKENFGKQLISKNISIEDHSSLPDDEGFFEEKMVLIEEGVLKSFLSDFSFSLKGFGKAGRGRRESFRTVPLPRQNLLVLKALKTKEEKALLNEIKEGFLVERIKFGALNFETLDYEFLVTAAYYIEDGEISGFTDNFLIKGNFLADFLKISEFSSSVYCNGYEGVCTKNGQTIRVGYKTPSFIAENISIKSIV